MALVGELPIMELAIKAEEKHGEDTHMVIEVVLKEHVTKELEASDYNPAYVGEEDVYWWVEFEDQIRVFDDFRMVEHYLMEQAVKTGSGPTVVIN